MKYKLFLSTLIATLLISPVYAQDASTDADATQKQDVAAQQVQEDSNILGILMVLNKNEIATAKLALRKTKNTDVQSFARFAEKQHTKALKDTIKVDSEIEANAKMSPESTKLQDDGIKEAKELSELKGAAFDKAYVDAIVKGHEDALKLVEDDLMKKVTNKKLAALLDNAKSMIQMHLEKAKELQKKLEATPVAAQ